MKLITLNIWGGHVHEPLLKFITAYQDVDILCFQEVYHRAPHKISGDGRVVQLNIFEEIGALLPEHVGFFRPTVQEAYGIALYAKKSVKVLHEEDHFIHINHNYPGSGANHSRNLQCLKCSANGKTYNILNVHGLWNGMGKTDTPDRIAQSKSIRNFMDALSAPKILCGDFNLRPDTASLAILAEGMHDWVAKYQIQSTRTPLYPKEEKFADYIFTSPEIQVNHFEVLKDVVSDHSPLLLDFI